MHTLLVYDIPNDRLRTRIADACLDYGLDRIQYSTFYGQLERGHREELLTLIEQILGKAPGNVQILPICERDWQIRLSLEQN
ncbi:MAG: CRISPR-associated endonuclease Cas2 [Anaerolineae bacterium]|nr:CRISPR-associated endonuclease Cas2 [Anaerolineae bacterium]